MAQLKDDCFAFGGELIPLDDALADLKARISPVVGTETVSTLDAIGRILAEDVLSARDVPPHDNSAVDGYAVYFEDLHPDQETRLPVAGRIAAGHPMQHSPRRGEAYRIFTGAPMPEGEDGGPDTIYMEEDCQRDGDTVILPAGLQAGSNRRKRGEDVKAGDIVLRRGSRLRAQEIGMAASVGRAELQVFEKLKVAVFSTGDEICDPSGVAAAGRIFDSNRYSTQAQLRELGCSVTDIGILPDNQALIAEALGKAARDHHLLITSGGVSAGEEDHVKAAVESQGTINLWRLAIKPGRPIALGQVGHTAFIGLPGNPVAAMVTFMTIARGVILMLSGAAESMAQRYRVEIGFDHRKKLGRREWVRVRLKRGPQNHLTAHKIHSGGSGILTSLVDADGLVELGEEIEAVKAGDQVGFLPFNEVVR
ncbi:MAG: molybdopterin molybdotransferase MoeA [Rhodospirillales bacterium]|nr:molybdopterin molybdotransferase MoeA [Rhodospirillales bacterium]